MMVHTFGAALPFQISYNESWLPESGMYIYSNS